jgi:uncharacterized protein YpmB
MKKKMNKIIIILGIFILSLSLIVFLYPKKCGNYGTAVARNLEEAPKYRDCECFGIKFSSGISIGGGYYYCYGICGRCKCYTYIADEKVGAKRIDIPC